MALQTPAILHLLRPPTQPTHAKSNNKNTPSAASRATNANGLMHSRKHSNGHLVKHDTLEHSTDNLNNVHTDDEFDELGRNLASLMRAGLLVLEPTVDKSEIRDTARNVHHGSIGATDNENTGHRASAQSNTNIGRPNADPHVEYGISLRLVCRKRVSHRFTQFRLLHATLEDLFPQYELPRLPDNSARFKLYRRSLDPRYIEAKRQLLNQYMRSITRLKGVGTCPAIFNFLIPNIQDQHNSAHNPTNATTFRRRDSSPNVRYNSPPTAFGDGVRGEGVGVSAQKKDTKMGVSHTRSRSSNSANSSLLLLSGVGEEPSIDGNGSGSAATADSKRRTIVLRRSQSARQNITKTNTNCDVPCTSAEEEEEEEQEEEDRVFFSPTTCLQVQDNSHVVQTQVHCALAKHPFAAALQHGNTHSVVFPFHRSVKELRADIRRCDQNNQQLRVDDEGQGILIRFDSLGIDLSLYGCVIVTESMNRACLTGTCFLDGHSFALKVNLNTDTLVGTVIALV